jgi:predicted transposase/invertase (TIGR01784 family)
MAKGKGLESIGSSVFMNIKTDFGFKKIFGNKVLLTAFLNAILDKDIAGIEYLPAEQLGYIRENRRAVYDVYCTAADGERFIVEMQASPQMHFAERILFYMSYPVISQAPKGSVTRTDSGGKEIKVPWNYSLSGVYMICILDNIMFPEKEAADIVTEQIKIVRQKAGRFFTDKWEVQTIELPKFRKTEDELETAADKWLYSLKHMEKLPGRPERLNDKIFSESYENAKINNLTSKDMKAYSKSVLEYDDVISSMNYREMIGRNEGRIEGRIEGRNEARIKFVQNCRKHNMTIGQIVALTSLTEKEISDILAERYESMH